MVSSRVTWPVGGGAVARDGDGEGDGGAGGGGVDGRGEEDGGGVDVEDLAADVTMPGELAASEDEVEGAADEVPGGFGGELEGEDALVSEGFKCA